MNAYSGHDRFGSARFATRPEMNAAGMYRQHTTSMLCGFDGRSPLWFDISKGGVCLTAGSQGGKGASIIIPNALHGILRTTTTIFVDFKGELAAVSQQQTPDQKYCITWNPTGMHGRPQHRINPVAFLKKGSTTLVADAQVLAENLCPRTSNPQGAFFELRAQAFLTAIILGVVSRDGVLTLPALYDAVNLIPAGGEAWLDLAYELHASGFDIAFNIEEEIAASREDATGGFRGIVGEVLKSVASLADPNLRASLSPPYDLTLDQLCAEDRFYHLYLMCPPESAQLWSPILKTFFVGAMIEKTRRPDAPRQFWVIDEAGQLGAFPLLIKLHTFGAGVGITPFTVFQSSRQMDNLGPNGRTIILSSSALQINFATRDIEEARRISDMLGVQTLAFDHGLKQGEAEARKRDLMRGLLDGHDPFALNARLGHLQRAESFKSKERRALRTPDEILAAPEGQAILFADGVRYPILAQRRRYFETAMFAGRYHPNPFYPPTDMVQVKTWLGRRWRRVITEGVPKRFAHYPQYSNGSWSRIGS